jgi:hypothetical protein
MAIQIQLRRGLAADWTSTNPTLAEGELGLEKDTAKLKVGNGSTAWTSLSYLSTGGGSGTVTSVAMSVPTGLSVAGSPVTTSGTLAVTLQAGYSIPTTSSQTNWDSAYSERRQWDGGSTNLVAATGRTSLGLVIGTDVLAPNGSAASLTSFPTFNQNTTGTAAGLSATLAVTSGGTGQTSYTDGQLLIGNSTGNTLAKATLTAGSGISITNGSGSISIAATNSGTVTSVTGTSPVVSSGGTTPAISLAASYGDTQNPYASKTANFVLASPNGSAGVPTFRAIVAADVPTLNQNTTGTASNVTGTVAVANGGTGLTTTPANGALDIGNGTGFTRTTLTAGSNITITNASGSITIASTASGGGSSSGANIYLANNFGGF